MTKSQKFYSWWQNKVKGNYINDETLETIIIKLDKQMGVTLKKYIDSVEVEKTPFQTQKQALAEIKKQKSEMPKDKKIKTKFRIV